jgi:hypothetical protein
MQLPNVEKWYNTNPSIAAMKAAKVKGNTVILPPPIPGAKLVLRVPDAGTQGVRVIDDGWNRTTKIINGEMHWMFEATSKDIVNTEISAFTFALIMGVSILIGIAVVEIIAYFF